MARPARKRLSEAEMKQRCQLSDDAWSGKMAVQWLYDEATRWAVPFRRPANYTSGESRVDHLFSETAIVSTFHGAGALKEDLFPSGQAFYRLEPGPLAKVQAANVKVMAAAAPDDPAVMDEQEKVAKFAQNLASITQQVQPFFQTGEFDQATSEMALDLYIGTAALVPLRGDEQTIVRFLTVPIDECALEQGPFGDVVGLYWKTRMTRAAIKGQWPKGEYSEDFLKALEDPAKISDKIELRQDWYQDGKVWRFVAWLSDDKNKRAIVTEAYRTKPFVAARYHKVPGETYGRGPVMLAIPAIKTANKAQELALKAAAIGALGLWTFRPGGAFNPDTVRVVPGGFWPVTSNGGMLGPDVQRFDTGAAGNLELARMTATDLDNRIKIALNDDRLPERSGSTPISASEVMARMAKVKQNYVGAFGRLINEIIPSLVARVMEILYDAGALETDLTPDQLFVQIRVTSPLAVATRVSHLEPFMQFVQLCGALGRDPDHFIRLDDKLDEIAGDLDIPATDRRTPAERTKLRAEQEQAQQAQMMAASVAQNPKNAAEAAQTVAGMAEGQTQ